MFAISSQAKKLIVALSGALCLVATHSCSDEQDADREHRSQNEAAFRSFADSTGYERTSLPGLSGDNFVYMKKIKAGSGTTHPLQTSVVKYRYSMYPLTQWVGNGNSAAVYEDNLALDNPSPTQVSTRMQGLSIALQNMVVGDKVGIAVPWYLAAGNATYRTLQAYTGLYYVVELIEIQ